MNKILFGLLGAGVAVGVACSNPTGNGSGCGGNGLNLVVITANDNHTFTPQNVQVSQTQQICFQNLGTVLHTVTPDSSVSNSDSIWIKNYGSSALPSNSPYLITLPVGNYAYHCQYHGAPGSGMYGTITVR